MRFHCMRYINSPREKRRGIKGKTRGFSKSGRSGHDAKIRFCSTIRFTNSKTRRTRQSHTQVGSPALIKGLQEIVVDMEKRKRKGWARPIIYSLRYKSRHLERVSFHNPSPRRTGTTRHATWSRGRLKESPERTPRLRVFACLLADVSNKQPASLQARWIWSRSDYLPRGVQKPQAPAPKLESSRVRATRIVVPRRQAAPDLLHQQIGGPTR